MENVVSNIKSLRESRGMSQDELGRRSGLNRNSIYKYESGKRQPTVEHLINIYKALGIKLTLTYEAIQGGEDE